MLQAEGLNPQAQRVRVLAPPKPHHPSPPKPQPALPPSPLQPSRFAHPNPFQPLSNDTFPPDPSHPSDFVSPFCLDSDCLDLPPSPVKSPSLSRSVSWSDPLVTLSVSQKFSAYPSSHPNRNTSYIRFLLHRDSPLPAPVDRFPPSIPPAQALTTTSGSALASLSSAPPLIADSGCTGVLLRLSNFPSLQPFFTPKPLPLAPFTLPDRSVLQVGGPSHLTGELRLPHKTSPISCYFLPDFALSHSLVGLSPLLRPHGLAIFTPTSVSVCLLHSSLPHRHQVSLFRLVVFLRPLHPHSPYPL